jgi:transcriptional regulator with XRE-family HTH domain
MTPRLHVSRIKELAELKGFGDKATMAAKFGLSRQQVYLLLRGGHMPSLLTARRMARALDVSIEELIIESSRS